MGDRDLVVAWPRHSWAAATKPETIATVHRAQVNAKTPIDVWSYFNSTIVIRRVRTCSSLALRSVRNNAR